MNRKTNWSFFKVLSLLGMLLLMACPSRNKLTNEYEGDKEKEEDLEYVEEEEEMLYEEEEEPYEINEDKVILKEENDSIQ